MIFPTDLIVQQLLCALLQVDVEHPVLWYRTIFPGNLLHDSPEGSGENSLSLQPEAVSLQLTEKENDGEEEFRKCKDHDEV